MGRCYILKKNIAESLLEIKAVSLRPNDPFTWTSGIQSPIYCDNRLTLSYPEIRRKIAAGLANIITEKFSGTELVAGTATAGIPHAAWVSEELNLPMCYVRSKAKGHGKGNQIEGKAEKGQKVVVVEDLISTGGSVITAVEALREAGCDVLGVVSIFTYELQNGRERLSDANITTYSLTDFSTLVEVASEKGYIEASDWDKLMEWRKNPAEWGK
jgi:orotate phosphoribosyltransferase